MKKIKVIGNYITKFGELWDRSLESLFEEALHGSLVSVEGPLFKNQIEEKEYGTKTQKSKFDPTEIEAVFVANMAAGQYTNQLHLNALVSQMLPHRPPAFRFEAACASGSMAAEAAELALLSGKYKTVLVVGAEKMTDVSSGDTTRILASASEFQKEYGSNFPALYALLAQAHMKEFGTTRQQLSAVASKNHKHAITNNKAQFRREIQPEVISKSMSIADPIRLLDCSPVSDGASAVILSSKDIKKYSHKTEIVGVGHAQDSLSLSDRKLLTELNATKKAANLAYAEAGVRPKDISYAEVHDCFTIAEILASEDLGFIKKGLGGEAVTTGKTTYGGTVVINPSGGLKACGHPVGATGIKQIAFISNLLEEEKKAKYAVTHNVGGSGATAIVHVLKSGNK
jgi:acetyl-CoA C-acetyltransferase